MWPTCTRIAAAAFGQSSSVDYSGNTFSLSGATCSQHALGWAGLPTMRSVPTWANPGADGSHRVLMTPGSVPVVVFSVVLLYTLFSSGILSSVV